MKLFGAAFLIISWVSFWGFIANKFHWPVAVRRWIPTALFIVPMAMLHWFDPNLGTQKGDWPAALLILGLMAFVCGRSWTLIESHVVRAPAEELSGVANSR
ncbi:MAG: hypothetical protein ABI824_14575 [Acidobacteriota bacterium]